ncbi:uncharacterized protein LOC122503220 [Leptopilina heterotoma]|uniref:uncharacterized protein LOC122503220 n=1 Tax=Leptopilina heterotoma TaxID=63436 RepID=UPI001CA9AA71|nr:uncharacterized protein LOC122503220 [Leptopilina heterotoma]
MMTVLLNILFSITLRLENIASCYERYKISLLTTYGTIFQQGSEFCPENPSGRVGFLTLGIFSLLTFNFYSAYLVSARLNEPIIKMNDSLYSLSKSNLKVASEPLIYLNFYLKFYRNKWLTTQESERFLLPEEGIRKVYEGNFAYHSETDILYPYIEKLFDNQRICEITTVHMVHPTLLPLYISKGSPFTEIAKIGLAKLYDMGIRHRELNRWAAREPQCQKELLGVSSITIYETIPTLVLLNSGVLFSIIILFAEITHK